MSNKMFEPGVATMADLNNISKNSQKLFNYLLCLAGNPHGEQKRIFQHRNINLQLIHRTIDISVPSLKKYWFELEEGCHIRYGNNGEEPADEVKLKYELCKTAGKRWDEMDQKEKFEIWKKLWTERKKRPSEYYTLWAGSKYRNIPEETLRILNEEIKMTEQDIKIYQFLLTYREIGTIQMIGRFPFSMEDIRLFLKKKKEQKLHLSIYKSLLLLEKYGLIKFKEVYRLNSKNVRIRSFELEDVKFYVSSEYRNCSDEERELIIKKISEEIESINNEENE